MYNSTSTDNPTISDCTFTGNSAEDEGGGMFTYGGAPSVSDCTFTANTAAFGGGVYNFGSSAVFSQCTFDGNQGENSSGFTQPVPAFGGGGIYNDQGSDVTISDCAFLRNVTSWGGGGIMNYTSSPTVTRCVFEGNSSGFGAGVCNQEVEASPPILTDCDFCGNTVASGNANIDGLIDAKSGGNRLLLNCNTGDVNFDLAIDSGDLGYLLAQWGASSVLNADINQDGEVNGADLAYILSYFGGATDATTAP